MSTAMVPPQRQDWWARELRQTVPVLRRLPMEVFDLVIERVEEWPIGRDEAEKMRREFWEEREEFREKHTKAFLDYLPWDLDTEDMVWIDKEGRVSWPAS